MNQNGFFGGKIYVDLYLEYSFITDKFRSVGIIRTLIGMYQLSAG